MPVQRKGSDGGKQGLFKEQDRTVKASEGSRDQSLEGSWLVAEKHASDRKTGLARGKRKGLKE